MATRRPHDQGLTPTSKTPPMGAATNEPRPPAPSMTFARVLGRSRVLDSMFCTAHWASRALLHGRTYAFVSCLNCVVLTSARSVVTKCPTHRSLLRNRSSSSPSVTACVLILLTFSA